MSKALKRVVNLRVAAGVAKPGPAIGQALGPLGINMMEFCKAFNERTKDLTPEIPTPVKLSAYEDRSFDFTTQSPPTSWFLKRCAGIQKGSGRPGYEAAGTVTLKQVYEIVLAKQKDAHLWHLPPEALARSIIGSAASMGLKVVDDRETNNKAS
ncbi:unnamed protein product [Heterosigma akashiwo]|uniref:Large ribosomal subunit protein uL11m n=1 Tax=Heterosigma akashiwo TaxID=2829 RepID=A0A6V2RJT6_HETAK|mmetsp:Transcript_9201/g.12861  ORF Transcript_9201/g.12861 Transcript_9201/m.12861 type:complete len:154 (+) Transcript_9201:67-528(+)